MTFTAHAYNWIWNQSKTEETLQIVDKHFPTLEKTKEFYKNVSI
jgi:hypothetical protein